MKTVIYSNTFDYSYFLFLQRKYLDLPMKSVASDLHMSVSKLSRIENNKFTLTDNLIMSLLDIYHVSIEEFKQADKEYEQLLYLILDHICEGVNDGFDLITDLDILDEKYANIKIPTSLMIRFIVYTFYYSYNLLDKKNIEEMNHLYDDLFDNIMFFSSNMQKIFYIFSGEMLYFKKSYLMAKDYFIKAEKQFNMLGKYDVLLYGYLLNCLAKSDNDFEYYGYYSKYNSLCIQYGLSKRMIRGKISYSSFLRSIENYRLALKNDCSCLKVISNDQNVNLTNVLLFNIGIDYKFLREYDKASEYIEKTIDYWNDYEAYFELSYCLYKCNSINKAKEYIKIAKKLDEKENTYLNLINWLEFIIKGSLDKAENVLVNVYNKEYSNSSMITKRSFLILLSEQYVLMNNYELAYKYSDQLNML